MNSTISKENSISKDWFQAVIQFVFGKSYPEIYTRFVFYSAVIVAFLHLLWSTLCLISVKSVSWIETHKTLNLVELFNQLGDKYELSNGQLFHNFSYLHCFSILIWSLNLISCVLIWRKLKWFPYVYFTSLGLYFIFYIYFLGFTIWYNETSKFDKFVYFFGLIVVLIYTLLTKAGQKEIKSFFQEEEKV